MRYLKITPVPWTTGINEQYTGLYLEPDELSLPHDFKLKYNNWLIKYRDAFQATKQDGLFMKLIDEEGIELTKELVKILGPEFKISYFSDWLGRYLLI